jgi:hypothetical protein
MPPTLKLVTGPFSLSSRFGIPAVCRLKTWARVNARPRPAVDPAAASLPSGNVLVSAVAVNRLMREGR